MILRDIFIELDRRQFASDAAYAFKLRSRCLCHFVGRHVWKKKIRVLGFNRIVVELSKDKLPSFVVNSCQVACIKIPLSGKFDNLRGVSLDEFYIACLTRGIDQFLDAFPEAVTAIHDAIGHFRTVGYKNEWIERKRRLRELGLTAVLSCRMTHERFVLRLIVERTAKTIYDQEIFVSDPDEIAFAHRFKDVVTIEGKLAVLARLRKPFLVLSPEEIDADQTPNQARDLVSPTKTARPPAARGSSLPVGKKGR